MKRAALYMLSGVKGREGLKFSTTYFGPFEGLEIKSKIKISLIFSTWKEIEDQNLKHGKNLSFHIYI